MENKECKVFGCPNTSSQGTFVGVFCKPCFDFITKAEGKHNKVYLNALELEKANK